MLNKPSMLALCNKAIPFCLQAFESSQQTVSYFEYKEMANQACV
ncbi:hypothetical protein [Acinetobacter sp. YH12105]|nr:hypothetical protein [Acinetobacter sp. YH12105]